MWSRVPLAADGHGVRADRVERQPLVELLGGLGGVEREPARQRCARRRRLRAADAVDRHALAGQQRELVEAPVRVAHGDRAHPRLALAGRVGDPVGAAHVLQVAVVAGHVAAHALLHLRHRAVRRRLREQVLDRVVVDDLLVEEVRVQVVRGEPVAALLVAAVGAEPARPLGADGHVVLGDRADVVLRERVAVAVADARVRLRLDVRDAVRGAADLRVVVGSARVGRRQQRAEQHQAQDGDQPSPHDGES